MPSLSANRRSSLSAIALFAMARLASVLFSIVLLLATCLFAFGPAQAARSDFSALTTPKQDSFIQFPTDRSVGRLFVHEQAWRPTGRPPQGKFYAQARGKVRLKPGTIVNFEPNIYINQHAEAFARFPSDSLGFVSLSRLEVNDEVMAAVGKAQTIRALNLQETDITDERLKHLSNLINLQYLDLSDGAIKGPGLSYIAALKDLRRLDLSYDPIEHDPARYLNHFPHLTSLLLARCHLTDSDLVGLSKLQSIEHLKLASNNDITDKGIKNLVPLKKLHTIEIDDTQATPNGLLALKGLPIDTIWLNKRDDNKSTTTMLQKAFPKVELKFRGRGNLIPVDCFAPLH